MHKDRDQIVQKIYQRYEGVGDMKLEGYIVAIEKDGIIYYYDEDTISDDGEIVLRFTGNIHKASMFVGDYEAESYIKRLITLGRPLRTLCFCELMHVGTQTLVWDFDGKEGNLDSMKILEVKRSIKTKIVGEGIKS